MKDVALSRTVSLAVEARGGATVLLLSGWLDAMHAGAVWKPVLAAATRARGHALAVDVTKLAACDTAGAALLLAAERAYGAPLRVEGASGSVAELLARIRAVDAAPSRRASPAEHVGIADALAAFLRRAGDAAAFLGEAVAATLAAPWRRRMLRTADLWRIADQAGVRAVPLVLLLGLLMGLILAFQSLIPLRRFGADLYVANLVGISLTRELGPLLAAVILAGRTGSAFAAEIGTMQVNEEIDALKTLGLDPVTILVLPRLIAASLVMPALAVLLEIAGLLGMTLVLGGFGFPPVAIANQLALAVKPRDFIGGMVKAVVFGCVIAAIGCRAGLQTGVGPRAVGLSATKAVVGGIVSTVALDGGFALLFYRMGV